MINRVALEYKLISASKKLIGCSWQNVHGTHIQQLSQMPKLIMAVPRQ